MDKDLKRMIIQSHTISKHNFCTKAPEGYAHLAPNGNVTCTDKWDIYLKINKNKVEDIQYSGGGCAISTSSLSILSELLKGKTIDEANAIIEQYTKMIKGEAFNKDILDELIAFENVHTVWNRVECALVGSKAISSLLGGRHE